MVRCFFVYITSASVWKRILRTDTVLPVGWQPVTGVAQTLERSVGVGALAVPAKARFPFALVHVRTKSPVRRNRVSRLTLAQIRARRIPTSAVEANPRVFVTLVDVWKRSAMVMDLNHKLLWPLSVTIRSQPKGTERKNYRFRSLSLAKSHYEKWFFIILQTIT